MLRPYTPSTHISHLIHIHIHQSGIPKHFRNSDRTGPFGTGGGGNRRQRRLTRQGCFVRALDVGQRGADAIVGEQGVDHGAKV